MMTKTKNCPECKTPMAEAIYGMPTQEDFENPNYIIMGCLVDEDMMRFGCRECGFEIYSSGRTGNPRKDRALGSILGLAIGDALGAPYEFKPPVTADTPITMDFNDNWTPGKWTDDTAMTIAIMQAWLKHGNITSVEAQDTLVQIWKEWSKTAPDVGIQTRQVLMSLKDETAAEATQISENLHHTTGRSGGNGSLMRTAPLAFLKLPDAEVAKVVTQISKLTHFEDDAAHACIIWVFAIRHAIETGQLDFEPGFAFLPEEAQTKWHGLLKEAEEHPPVYFENNGWVVSAFQAAASAVMIGEYDFTEGIEAAIRSGYDTDTVAAIAGSLLGALCGAENLPDECTEILHGWPNFKVVDLASMISRTNRIPM
jgi:ADP-ribosyl-[dinitrogen reductase] hydrolase